MIKGIGCDLCAVARMEKIIAKPSGMHFLQRVFTQAERDLFGLPTQNATAEALAPCSARQYERMAANFAAKEAFLKAVGTGLAGFALAEIAALRHENGAPYYACSGKAADYLAQHQLVAHLSLSHETGMAMAYCILEKVEDNQ